jgi:Coenzyme PQQ synthesis protein D (PqqD)
LNQKKNDIPPAKAREDDLVVQELPDELLVYDLKNHKAHCLNETAAFVWNHCDGTRTAGELAKLMEEEWHNPVSEDLIWFALGGLSRAGLLRDRIVLPSTKSRISRRGAIKQLGFGALVAVPLVMSIIAPTAMAGASIPAACQSCVKKSTGIGDCPAACLNIAGTCYGNSGCGAGQAKPGCQTCAACFSTAEATVSWTKPGVNSC